MHVVGSDYVALAESQSVVCSVVYFIPHIKIPFKNKVKFKHFIKFAKDNFFSVKLSWRQRINQVEDELLEVNIWVAVERKMLKFQPLIICLLQKRMHSYTSFVVFAECQEFVKEPDEVLIQKDMKYPHFNFWWQFSEHLLVFIWLNAWISIVCPFVLKEIFDFLGDVWRETLGAIKLRQQRKKFGKLHALVVILIEILKNLEHLCKIFWNEGVHGHPNK